MVEAEAAAVALALAAVLAGILGSITLTMECVVCVVYGVCRVRERGRGRVECVQREERERERGRVEKKKYKNEYFGNLLSSLYFGSLYIEFTINLLTLRKFHKKIELVRIPDSGLFKLMKMQNFCHH